MTGLMAWRGDTGVLGGSIPLRRGWGGHSPHHALMLGATRAPCSDPLHSAQQQLTEPTATANPHRALT